MTMIRQCDICDSIDDVQIVKLFSGMGYAPSVADPLAHTRGTMHKNYDLCETCREAVMESADALSKQQRLELVMVNILDNPIGGNKC